MKKPGVLESTRPVVDGAEHVQIDRSRVQALCREWAQNPVPIPPWDDSVHFSEGSPATANYVLLLDALNFSFWPDPGQPRWTIDYKGRTLGGYMALAASLKRGVEEGVPLLDADWLARVTPEQLLHVFRGEGRIPMLERRVENAREAGQVLKSRYGGSFARAIESCQGSAVQLVELLERDFSSFRDVSTWKGRMVRILKRAQITAVDLYGTFGGTGLGNFSDLEELTAFADYKIPQVLRALGVLEYSPSLAGRVDRMELLEPGSLEEVEIRAAMVWATEWIRQGLQAEGLNRRAFELDWFLWNMGQAPLPEQKPYHRTRTWFY
ncbi:MAG: queuosine 5'-phosphate N-glycosylase/hydrolase [Candidatus Xenobium sp.]